MSDTPQHFKMLRDVLQLVQANCKLQSYNGTPKGPHISIPQAPDSTGNEWDGLKEILCPSDMRVSKSDGFEDYIGQEEFKDLIHNFRPGVWGVVVLDCCHSGDDSPGDLLLLASRKSICRIAG
jgi:hypothetical protein